MWYLFEYDGFQWLMQVKQHIYLQDYRRHSVAVSQRRNDHMQVYIIIMGGKNFFLGKKIFSNILFWIVQKEISNDYDLRSTFWFFSFPVSNFKCNLIFFNFQFVIQKQNNKSVTFEFITQREMFIFLLWVCNSNCKLFLDFELVTQSVTFYFSTASKYSKVSNLKFNLLFYELELVTWK